MSKSKELEAELQTIEKDVNQIDRAIEKLSNKKQKLLSRKRVINQLIQENASEQLANQDWERSDHPWSNKVNDVLKTAFKMDKFRPYQMSTINAVMSKQDCILLMPTGGGKSLCYQLPAMVLEGITLVVSPLVSLMEDQIMAMEALNVPAALLNASSTREHVNHVHKQMTERNPSIKLLYVTPEKLAKSKRFMAKLEKMHKMGLFSLLAIDEVHCCSQWGHDFRTDYKFLGIMKRQFPRVPILGLTATATSSVIADVQSILNIHGCLVLKASFNRPNLKYEVVCKSACQKDNISELENLLRNRFNGLSGIIYCFSIKDCEEIANELRKCGIKAKAYHAQLDAKSRSFVHKNWSSNSIQVIVATVAFGMGIDKPDVRFVIHHSMPKSMENFYQESGRAGRDDHSASCILFYRFPDIFRQSTMVFTEQKGLEHLYAMIAYCLDLSRCRRAIIAQHFGERWNSADCNSMCDHCEKFTPYEEKTKNTAREYKTICSILDHCNVMDERLTSQKLIEAWQGKGPPKLRPPSLNPTTLTRENSERIIALLLLDSYLIEEFHFTPYSTISYINIGSRNLPANQELFLPMPCLRAKSELSKGQTSSTTSENSKSSNSEKSITNSKKNISSSKSNSSEKHKNKYSLSEASSSKKETNSSSQNHSQSGSRNLPANQELFLPMPCLRAKSELSKGQTSSTTSENSKSSNSEKSITNSKKNISSSKSNSSEKHKNKYSLSEASSSKKETNSSSQNHSQSGSRNLPANQELFLPMPCLRAKSELSKGQTSSTTSENSKSSNSEKSITNSLKNISSSEKHKNKYSLSEASSSKKETNSSSQNHSQSSKSSIKLCVVSDGKSHFNDLKLTITSPSANETFKTAKKRKSRILSDDEDVDILEIKTSKSTKKSNEEIVISEDDEIHLPELEFDDYDIAPRKKLSTKKCVPMLTVSDSD